MIPSWASFWYRSQYGERAETDLPNMPRELNPYERWWVRLAFADMKLVVLLAAGVAFGGLSILWMIYPWVLGGLLIAAFVAGIFGGVFYGTSRNPGPWRR